METRSAKRRKLIHSSLRKEAEAEAAKTDHISNLPDDVIHRILGLLPLKTIAITSVLSRRWAQIWHSFPDLDFTTVSPTGDHHIRLLRTKLLKRFRGVIEGTRKLLFLHDHDQQSSSSRDFITKVLSFRHKNSDLRTLRLHAYVSLTCLNNLIRRALRFNVCELDVEFATDGSFNMPKRVISNGSIRILRFRSKFPFPGFRPPPLGALKSGSRFLQELALSRVILDKQPLLTDVFTDTSFPALKKLSLTDCSRLKRINIRCYGLQEVTLQHCMHLEILEVVGARLDKLRVANCFHINYVNPEHSLVKVDAPRLRVVEWEHNGVTGKTLFRNLTAMESASVGYKKIHDGAISLSTIVSTSSFLLGLCHVRRLKLWSQCVTIMEDRNFGTLTPFNNLGFLDVSVSFSKSTTRALSLLFRSCISLHTFILSNISSYNYDDGRQWNKDLWKATSLEKEEYWETQMHAMKPFMGHLKVVKIGGFMENEDQVSMVKFLLKYGHALEEMAVKYYSNSHVSLAQAKSQFTQCTRAASNAKIYIL